MNNYIRGADLATDLVNTYEVFAREEHLGSVEALADFATNHGFDTGNVTPTDLDRLRAARLSLRSGMLSNNEEEAVATLNDLLVSAQPKPRLVTSLDGEWIFAYADPKAALADRILAEATAEVLNEIRNDRLRWFSTCFSSTCEDVFVDKSRNHSRRYCSPDVCGNREAQRAHRSRQANRSNT
jgi:predicted RNA-binding Zn ribbon-like protein